MNGLPAHHSERRRPELSGSVRLQDCTALFVIDSRQFVSRSDSNAPCLFHAGMLEKDDECGELAAMDWWRSATPNRWITPDRVILAALLGIWWFLLQRNGRVLDLVDTVSYLTGVYSAWQAGRSVWAGIRRRELVGHRRTRSPDGVPATVDEPVSEPGRAATRG
jgi:hypothetical protein